MLYFEEPNIQCVKKTDNYGLYVVGPFERGFGQTIGNALRRTLLSSLEGFAITAVKFNDGTVLHEMSTIEGVKEDVTQIILKLKQLRLIVENYDDANPKHIRISAHGPCIVKAEDVEPDADVEIVSPELEIATLDAGAVLDLDMIIGRGSGYVPSSRNKQEGNIGYIAIDSIYSPIRKVNFTVENTRVGQSINYDQLTLEVETTGTKSPDEAISDAATLLRRHLLQFENLTVHAQGNEVCNFAEKPQEEKHSLTSLGIDELDLSVRSFNSLKRAGIHTVGDLIERDEESMLRIRNLGRKSLEEIHKKLTDLGLAFKSSDD